MPRLYMYVVDRDFGFAPNPFHGTCTLATCKPDLRSTARIGDWIAGMGGRRLKATGRLVFAMEVAGGLVFDDYWHDPRFFDKRPVRNGSRTMMVGDNIYHRPEGGGPWIQEDSHHSAPDGSPDLGNIQTDTRTDRMLHSGRFVYFGRTAPEMPNELLRRIGYENGRKHRVFDEAKLALFLDWLLRRFGGRMNEVLGLPFQFDRTSARFTSNRIVYA